MTGFDKGSVTEGQTLADGLNCTVRAIVFDSCGFFVSNNFGVGPKGFVGRNADDGWNDFEVEDVGVLERVGLGDMDRVEVGVIDLVVLGDFERVVLGVFERLEVGDGVFDGVGLGVRDLVGDGDFDRVGLGLLDRDGDGLQE
jgi:hypothetical protein